MVASVTGLRSLVFLVLGFGLLSCVLAFDNSKNDNVSTKDCSGPCFVLTIYIVIVGSVSRSYAVFDAFY